MLIPPWVVAAAALISFAGGWQVASWKCEAAKTTALEAQQLAFDRQLAKQNTAAAEYEADRETGRVEARTREAEVRTIYESVEVPGECAAPPAVRGVLEQAVTSANTAAAKPDR